MGRKMVKENKLKEMVKKGWPHLVEGFTGPFFFPVNWFTIQLSIWTIIFWPSDSYIHYSELAYAFSSQYSEITISLP